MSLSAAFFSNLWCAESTCAVYREGHSRGKVRENRGQGPRVGVSMRLDAVIYRIASSSGDVSEAVSSLVVSASDSICT